MDANDILLTDQVAIITGGGGGIGRAIALAFASVGANIVIGDIVPERCEETAARVREFGRKALSVPTDVMNTDQVRALIERAASEFGRIDILVNNAGGVTPRPFIEQSERSWRRHIDLNLVSALAATSAAVPVMIKGGRGGSIISVTSIEGSRAAPNYSVYAACKAGLNNFTRTLAVELAVAFIYLKVKRAKGRGRILLTVLLANIFSVTMLWFVFVLLLSAAGLVLGEIFAVVFEGYAVYYFNRKSISLRDAMLMSLIMNVASVLIGGVLALSL